MVPLGRLPLALTKANVRPDARTLGQFTCTDPVHVVSVDPLWYRDTSIPRGREELAATAAADVAEDAAVPGVVDVAAAAVTGASRPVTAATATAGAASVRARRTAATRRGMPRASTSPRGALRKGQPGGAAAAASSGASARTSAGSSSWTSAGSS